MRAMIVSLALVVSVAMCMVFLALFAGIGANATVFVTTGLGLFMVAALFAAISVLGPKFRPTPLLTPTMAGTIGASVMTVAIIVAGNLQPGQEQRAALRQSAPPALAIPAPVAPSVVTMAPLPSTQPVQSAPPVVEMIPAVPMAPEPQVPPARMAAPAPSAPPEAPPAASPPVESVLFAPDADIAPVAAEEPDASAGAESDADVALVPAGPPAQAPIPLPPIPPRLTTPSETLVLSEEPFDTSSASSAANAPVIPSPPLPRSRPCGEGGPPCP